MRETKRQQDLRGAIAAVAAAITPHLRGSVVDRSRLEVALNEVGGGSIVRDATISALNSARITVFEDLPDSGPQAAPEVTPPSLVPPVVAVSSSEEDLDPDTALAAARRRLELDRELSPHRRAKVVLTALEEVGLALIYRKGGDALGPGDLANLQGEARDAAEAMILHNMGLTHSVVLKYLGRGLEHEDLAQHAVRGLMRAVEMFDPHAGFKFSTYATWWLRQAVGRALADEGRVIRLPVHMYESVRKVVRTRERLTVAGQPPNLGVLAAACELEVSKVVECLRLAPAVISLDTPLGDDGFTLGDLVDAQVDVPEHVEVHGLYPDDLERLLGFLSAREEDVLRRRFGLPPYNERMTLDDIGLEYRVTRERIRQIQKKAMDRMRGQLVAEGRWLQDVDVDVQP